MLRDALMRLGRPGGLLIRISAALLFLLIIDLGYHYSNRFIYRRNNRYKPLAADVKPDDVHLVVASTKSEDTSWVREFFPQWQSHVYVADDPSANLTVPENKGHEAAAYLTFIIDNYDALPDYTIFLHASRYQWHNEDPLYDGVRVLQQLQFPYVAARGFTSLRCTWKLGCPSELRNPPGLAMDVHRLLFATDRDLTEAAYPGAFKHLFPNDPVPRELAVHCGAQFAATRAAVQTRSKEDYVRIRDWMYGSDLPDNLSGRILEYAWHVMMGAPAVDCPDAGKCFCEKFALCDLTCAAHKCRKRYWFKFGKVPDGWPERGAGRDGWPSKDWAD